MDNPLISIISINRNNAAGLRQTLATATEQTFRNFEHIVIDGASNDGSMDVIREFESDLKFWCSERDSGIYDAMNKGIAAAGGDYLLFLNSGDHLINEGALSSAAAHLGAHDLCYCDIEVRMPARNGSTNTRIKQHPDVLRFSYFLNDTLPHPASFIRRSLFERFGEYDESLKICADWKAFVLWVCKYSCSYQHIPQALSVHYADGLSSQPESRGIIAAEQRIVLAEEFPAFINDGRDAIAAREALHQIAALRQSLFVRVLQTAGLLWRF